ncbi:protein smoothened [Cloeon dipterum]|uniref:protein smoothened n=1 Tax=Cloeon dipterum TaxID=197152 RepID=UPI00321FA4E1
MRLAGIFWFLLIFKSTIASFDAFGDTLDLADNGKSRRSKNGVSLGQDFCQIKINTTCENINNTWVSDGSPPLKLKCFGNDLPYTSVSLDLLPNVHSLTGMLEIVESLEILHKIPKCWAVVQPLICAFHLPQCVNDSVVYLPSQTLCRSALSQCKLLGNDSSGFPEFLRCSNTTLFPHDCKDSFQEMKFNTSSACPYPLVREVPPSGIMFTDPKRHYPRLEGCNLPCETPLYSKEELDQLRKLIAWGGCIALALNSVAVFTFLIDWGSSERYPALIVYYLNLCCVFSNLGWLMQFLPGNRSDILCRKDGTARGFEPSMGENLSCIVVFIIVYYFMIAALVWIMVFSYAWYKSFKCAGLKKDETDDQSSYFHLAAWICPLILTIIACALGEVHPDSTSGICFIGTAGGNLWGAGIGSIIARWVLLIVPILICTIFCGIFLIKCLRILLKIKSNSRGQVSRRAFQQIQNMVFRLTIFMIIAAFLVIFTLWVHLYEYKHADSWHSALDEAIMCQALGKSSSCQLKSQPSLLMAQLYIILPFVFSTLAASWMFNKQTKETWKRFIYKKLPCCMSQYYADPSAMHMMEKQRIGAIQERQTRDINVPKHKVIAKAYAKRGMLKNEGRLSFSYRSSHGDPVGMDFDMDSQPSSKGFNSSWANKLPRLLKRRGAFPKFDSASDGGRDSIESDVGMSFRKVSLESRRNSFDSQVSITISEVVATSRHQTRGRRSRQKQMSHSVKNHRRSRHRNYDKRSKWGSRSSHVDQVSQMEFHASQIESSRHCSVSSMDSQNTFGFSNFMQGIPLPGPLPLAVENYKTKPARKLSQRRAALTDVPSSSMVAKLTRQMDSDISDEESNSGNLEDVEMVAIPGPSNQGPTIIEIEDNHPLNGRVSSHDSSDQSSSSSSSVGKNISKRSQNGSSRSLKKCVNSKPRNSPKKEESDMSSSSDEEAPFLTIAQVNASMGSKESRQSDKETKDIGVQVSFVKKKSTCKKLKCLTKSLYTQTQTAKNTQNSRSKSAGVY